jgi:hypothetical protein
MNTSEFAMVSDDDNRFDRLVDGELSAEEYKVLLESLDDEPGGWRRCAMAFLEAQALRRELVSVSLPSGSRLNDDSFNPEQKATACPPKTPDPLLPAVTSHARVAGWHQLLLLAASMLVAMSVGIVLSDWWRTPEPHRPSGPGVKLAHDGADGPQPQMLLPRPVGNARLVLTGPGGTQTEVGVLPINEYPGGPGRWIDADEPTLPVSLVSELQRRGHQVERQEQFVPVDLEDGRKAMIPVETIQITPVSRRAY